MTANQTHPKSTTVRLPAVQLHSLTDGELLIALRQGHVDAYEVLFTRHSQGALRAARRHTRDHQLAQDAVQGAFTNILSAVKSGSGPIGTFTPYLHVSVARHIHREILRRNREKPVPYDEEDLSLRPAACSDVFNSLLYDAPLRQAFQSLPVRWQLVLWHIDINGIPPRDAASLYGISPNAVVALHRRAKTGLRLALSQLQPEPEPTTSPRPNPHRQLGEQLPQADGS